MAVLKEAYEVESRLSELGVTKDELFEVVREAVGSRRAATPLHPLSAAGQFAYLNGTERLRQICIPKGWKVSRTEGVEAAYNPEAGVKLIYQNAERAGDPLLAPQAKTAKGPAAARAIEMGQGEFWPEMHEQEVRESTAVNWYLFVYADGDDVRVELSCPKPFGGNQFGDFHERILLVQKGEWPGIDIAPDDMPLPDYDVSVTRKE